jgi:hypothetical protein
MEKANTSPASTLLRPNGYNTVQRELAQSIETMRRDLDNILRAIEEIERLRAEKKAAKRAAKKAKKAKKALVSTQNT